MTKNYHVFLNLCEWLSSLSSIFFLIWYILNGISHQHEHSLITLQWNMEITSDLKALNICVLCFEIRTVNLKMFNTEDRNPESKTKQDDLEIKKIKTLFFKGRRNVMQPVHVRICIIWLLRSDGWICTKILLVLIGLRGFWHQQQKKLEPLSPSFKKWISLFNFLS